MVGVMSTAELSSRVEGPREQMLPSEVLGEHALRLTDDYRKALSEFPDFTKALSDAFLGTVPEERKGLTRYSLGFKHGDSEYVVRREVIGFPEKFSRLLVDKFPWATPSMTSETVEIFYERVGKGKRQHFSGSVHHFSRHLLSGARLLQDSDTQTAVRKAEEFLAGLQGAPEQPSS